MKTVFITVGIVALLITIVCLVIHVFLQQKIKEFPNDESFRKKLVETDFVSRIALGVMAIFYAAFKLFGEK